MKTFLNIALQLVWLIVAFGLIDVKLSFWADLATGGVGAVMIGLWCGWCQTVAVREALAARGRS